MGNMKKLVGLLAIAALVLSAGLAFAQTTTCDPQSFTLTAGYGANGPGTAVGTVVVSNDDTYLYITYNVTKEGATLTETQVAICDNPFASRPTPGLSPYKNAQIINNSATYTIPLSEVMLHPDCATTSPISVSCGDLLYIAAHASVTYAEGGGDTAYGGTCVGAGGGSWFCQIAYEICCGAPPPPETCDETAWGKGTSSTCFINITQLATDKWGWTNGPLSGGTYEFELWAGAGRCETSKGTKVGTITVEYAPGTATVTYSVTGDFFLTETHLWVGPSNLPSITKVTKSGTVSTLTAAPGQFPYTPQIAPDGKSAVAVVTGLTGDIYVAAHAVVNGFPCPPPPVPAVQ